MIFKCNILSTSFRDLLIRELYLDENNLTFSFKRFYYKRQSFDYVYIESYEKCSLFRKNQLNIENLRLNGFIIQTKMIYTLDEDKTYIHFYNQGMPLQTSRCAYNNIR